MAHSLAPQVDALPGRIPGRPEREPGDVVEEVTVHRTSPIDHRADPIARDQHVVVQEVAVDQVAVRGTVVDEGLESLECLLERSGPGRGVSQALPPSVRPVRWVIVGNVEEGSLPGRM